MSKTSKKSIVLLASLLTFASCGALVVSCGDQPVTPTPTPDVELTSLAISNKSELQAEWRLGEADRAISITAEPENFNVQNALDKGTLTITSSNTEAVTVLGKYLKAVAGGTSTITVKCGNFQDSVEVTVTVPQETIKVKMETPVVGKEFYFGTYQANIEKWIFADGTVDNGPRLNTVDRVENAVLFTFEESTTKGEWYVATTINGAKKYLGIADPTTDYHVNYLDTPYSWKWDDEYKSIHTVTKTDKGDIYLMAYQTFTTLSSSAKSFLNTSFLGCFYTIEEPVDATGIEISPTEAKVAAGGTRAFEYKLLPNNGTGTVEWTIEGNDALTISQEGVVTASETAVVGSTATVKATVTAPTSKEKFTAEATVTVTELINYGTEENPITVSEARAIIDKVKDSTNVTEELMFVEGIVSSNGAYDSSYGNWGAINLTNEDGTVELSFQLFRAKAKEGTGFEKTYAAKNSLVGKKIVFQGFGTYYSVKDLYETKQDQALLLSVTDGNVKPTSVTLDKTAIEVMEGNTQLLTASVLPYGSIATVTYASEDETIATVENGLVTAVKEGTTKVTATIEGLPVATCDVTVTKKATAEVGETLTYDFTSLVFPPDETGYSVDATDKTFNDNATGDTSLVTGFAFSKAYVGDNTAKTLAGLKLGSGKAVGSVTLTTSKDVVEVRVYARQYKTNPTQIDVNGEVKDVTVVAEAEPELLTYTLAASKTVKIATTDSGKRAWISKIELVFAK